MEHDAEPMESIRSRNQKSLSFCDLYEEYVARTQKSLSSPGRFSKIQKSPAKQLLPWWDQIDKDLCLRALPKPISDTIVDSPPFQISGEGTSKGLDIVSQQQPRLACMCPFCDSSNIKSRDTCWFWTRGLCDTEYSCKDCSRKWTVQAASSSHIANPNETHSNITGVALSPYNLEQPHPDASSSSPDVAINIPPEVGTNPRSFSSSPHPPAPPEDGGHRVQRDATPTVNENNMWPLNKECLAAGAGTVTLVLGYVGNRTSLSPNAETLLRLSVGSLGVGCVALQCGHFLSRCRGLEFKARFLQKGGRLAVVCGFAGAVGMILPDHLMFLIIGIACSAFSIATFLS